MPSKMNDNVFMGNIIRKSVIASFPANDLNKRIYNGLDKREGHPVITPSKTSKRRPWWKVLLGVR